MRHVRQCPGCGQYVFYDAPVEDGQVLEIVQLPSGRFQIRAGQPRRTFGIRTSGFVVLHECGDDGDGGDPVPAWPPKRPPGRFLSAERHRQDE